MELNHINLTVTDVQDARQFFETYFGLMTVEGTSDSATFVALKDTKGFVMTLMQGKKEAALNYPPTFHIGFLGQGKMVAQQLYERLTADGFDVKPPGHFRKDEFYFTTPFGITIQVS